tara:strand:- start:19829 stop:20557 length:729 start_codon:yes stop_codon:yes gene_type:complete
MSNGYIYIVTNTVDDGINTIDYINEAIFSAKSLRMVDKTANICLFTDKEIDVDKGVFDCINIVEMSLRCKQKYLLQSPYSKTIYIDSDTYVNHNINDMFELLDKYEFVCCNDFARKRKLNIPEYMEIPYGFSEINGGIIGYKKCENFTKFINMWDKYYDKYKSVVVWDQPSCRIALWKSDINIYILPTEYNRRSKKTKTKVIDAKRCCDSRFPRDHLKTRIFHFHGLEGMNAREMEEISQIL